MNRSTGAIRTGDLEWLAAKAAEEESAAFYRNPYTMGRYANRLLCRALCQGAALHYLGYGTGIKDWDVWSFYAALPGFPYPARWHGHSEYAGRRVDLFGRSLDVGPDADPVASVQSYLARAETESARQLAAKAVILIWPPPLLGTVAWDALA